MKKIQTSNKELLEILSDNGIEMICNEDMEIVISDEDAVRIEELVNKVAPAAYCDYIIENI